VTVAVADLLTFPPGAANLHEGRESAEVLALLADARSGSQVAFGELVRMHQRAVFRTAMAALGSREDAEDAAQDAFVVAWRSLRGFRGDSTFRTWLMTITWRKALDKRRKQVLWRRRTQPSVPDALASPLDTLAGTTPDPERATVAADLVRRVHQEILALTPKLRDTLLLAASGEHSYDEIATMLGVPIGTVKWRVAEARRIVGSRVDER